MAVASGHATRKGNGYGALLMAVCQTENELPNAIRSILERIQQFSLPQTRLRSPMEQKHWLNNEKGSHLLLTATQMPQPARPERSAIYNYAYVRRGAGTVWLFAEPLEPMMHCQRDRPVPGRGPDASGVGRGQSSALLPSRVLDAGLRPPEFPSLFLPSVSAHQGAPSGPSHALGSSVHVPTWQLIETALSLLYSGHRQMSVDIDIHYTSAGGFGGFDQVIISLHNFSL